jgi:hypothetical protein
MNGILFFIKQTYFMFRLKSSLVVLFLFSFSWAQAQNWELGIFGGGASYKGDIDINLRTVAPQMRFSGGLFARKFITPHLSARAQFNLAYFYADEKKYPIKESWAERGFNFNSRVLELAVLGEWRPFKGKIQPYVFWGVSLINFRSQTFYNEPNLSVSSEEIMKDKLAVYPSYAFLFPIGGGIEFFLGDDFSLGLELGGRVSQTDYVDGIRRLKGSMGSDYFFIGGITVSKVFSGDSMGHRRSGRGRGAMACPTF